MKFLITRTSLWDENICPCEGAVKEKYFVTDERTVSEPPMNSWGKDWYSHGINHRIENGHIVRDVEEIGWFVEIPDLIEFSRQYGKIIVSAYAWLSKDFSSVEIYDDYRE